MAREVYSRDDIKNVLASLLYSILQAPNKIELPDGFPKELANSMYRLGARHSLESVAIALGIRGLFWPEEEIEP